MRPVGRRIDLDDREVSSVPSQVAAPLGEAAGMLPGDRPADAADSDVVGGIAPAPGPGGGETGSVPDRPADEIRPFSIDLRSGIVAGIIPTDRVLILEPETFIGHGEAQDQGGTRATAGRPRRDKAYEAEAQLRTYHDRGREILACAKVGTLDADTVQEPREGTGYGLDYIREGRAFGSEYTAGRHGET